MINQLLSDFNDSNEFVDLFYSIIECHGWIKTTQDYIYFRSESLSCLKRRAGQETICRSITNFGFFTPNGKRIFIEVGERPIK